MKHIRLMVMLVLAFGMAAVTSFAQEPAAGKVMIVMDASGSMWGQIQGEAKIVIARRVIHDLLKNWDPRIELGLAAYGHRRKGDCKDIEVLVPVGKGTQEAVLEAVDRLKPIGKTPLSDAVQMAAESLKYTEDRVTVILVSDGKETCKADPCLLGKELKEKGVDFTAHVIGFDVKKDEEEGLRCLAKNTGGLYVQASDSGSLKKALEATVTEVKKKAAAPVPIKVKDEEGIKLVAFYKAGGQEFKGQINWHILETKADLSGKRKRIAYQHRGRSGHVFRDLPPGKYVAVAELSDARYINKEYEITVSEGEAVVHELVLDIGTVRFDGRLAQGGEPFKGQLAWNVLSHKTDLSGKREKLTRFWRVRSGGIFLLPAGKWFINGVLPDARYITAGKEITVEPEGEEAHDFIFNAGRVRLEGRLAKGAEPFKGNLAWWLLSPKADLSGKRKEIAQFWRVNSGKVFILPAGDWLLQGSLPDHRHVKTETPLSLQPGEENQEDVIFSAGTVKINVTVKGVPHKGQVGWNIFEAKADKLSGKRQKVVDAWRVNTGKITILAAGDYHLTALLPDDRDTKGEVDFSVDAAEEKIVTVDLEK